MSDDHELHDPGLEQALDDLSTALGRKPVPKALEAQVLRTIDQAIASEKAQRGWSLVLLPAACVGTVVLLAYGPMLTAAAVVGVPVLSAAYGMALRWLMDPQVPAVQ